MARKIDQSTPVFTENYDFFVELKEMQLLVVSNKNYLILKYITFKRNTLRNNQLY